MTGRAQIGILKEIFKAIRAVGFCIPGDNKIFLSRNMLQDEPSGNCAGCPLGLTAIGRSREAGLSGPEIGGGAAVRRLPGTAAAIASSPEGAARDNPEAARHGAQPRRNPAGTRGTDRADAAGSPRQAAQCMLRPPARPRLPAFSSLRRSDSR